MRQKCGCGDGVFEKNHKPLNFSQTWSVWLGLKRGLCIKTVYLTTSKSDECLVENQITSEIPNITSGCYEAILGRSDKTKLHLPGTGNACFEVYYVFGYLLTKLFFI